MIAIRTALAILVGLHVLTPLAGSAQVAPFRVSWISPTRAVDGSLFLDELRGGLRELGHVEGLNVVIQPYGGEDSAERIADQILE